MEKITWITVVTRDSESLSGNNAVDDFMAALLSHEMSYLISHAFNDVDVEFLVPVNGDLNYGELRISWTPESLNIWLNDIDKQNIRETYEMDIINHAKAAANVNVIRYVGAEDVLNDPDRRMIEDFVESTTPLSAKQ